ncbi:putative invertase inhibitor [Neltuma alba]|uniref:putative invertase inhibitor n=1 Tax=Neltuma alba TaxID=207710 RepID=UPI0010A47D7A|nr:putative invertase inhibitor [Prosopis alba]
MKLAFDLILLLLILFVFQVSSSGSDLIPESCRNASKDDPNINYGFCVSSLEAISQNPPSRLEELVDMSVQITKSNATNIVSTISSLLKDPKFSDYAKKCLQDCSELYSDSVLDLDDAIGAFKSKDFNSASTKISAEMSSSSTCEDQFKDGNETSPLTEDNNTYFELNAMSLAFIQMQKQRS